MITIIITNADGIGTMTPGVDAAMRPRELPLSAPALSPPPALQDGYEWVRVGGRWVPVEDVGALRS